MYLLPRCALDSNVIFTFDYIVLVPIVSRIIAKDCGGKQEKKMAYFCSPILTSDISNLYQDSISLSDIEIRYQNLISLTEYQYLAISDIGEAKSESEIVPDMQESLRAHVSDIEIRDRDPISLCKIQERDRISERDRSQTSLHIGE